MLGVFKFLHVFLLASVKYVITFPYALLIGLDQTQAIIAVTFGGLAGFVFFYFLSGFLIRSFSMQKLCKRKRLPGFLHFRLVRFCNFLDLRRSKRMVFTRKNRFFVSFRKKYGLWGIIISTPVILSIPLGAFLLNKYYSRRRYAFAYMILSIVSWAVIVSAIVMVIPKPS